MGPHSCGLHRPAGFTLLELVIALAIFSVISVVAYSGLRSAQATRAGVEEAAERLSELQMALSIVARDLQQSVARPVRDSFGQQLEAMIGARSGVGTLLELTRTGVRNPTTLPRSHLQRVSYSLTDERLMRAVWPTLDRAYGAKAQETALLAKVKSVEFRFLDAQRAWHEQWPPLQVGESAVPALPIAVELAVEVEGWGRIVRLVRTSGEAPVLPPGPDAGAPVGGSGGGEGDDSTRNQSGSPEDTGNGDDTTDTGDGDTGESR